MSPQKSTTTEAIGQAPAPVTVDNFPRAETDMYFADSAARGGQLATPYHYREPMAIDIQTVVRTNRDSLYSSIVVDLKAGQVTVTLPDPGERFMSMIVLNEDHYAFTVYAPGSLSTGRRRAARAICCWAYAPLLTRKIPMTCRRCMHYKML